MLISSPGRRVERLPHATTTIGEYKGEIICKSWDEYSNKLASRYTVESVADIDVDRDSSNINSFNKNSRANKLLSILH